MNFLDELKSLDPKDPGRWPLAVRGFFVLVVFALCTVGFSYVFVWTVDRPVLQKAEADELDLRTQFENKQQRAANLDAYKQQLGEMERSFGAMLRQYLHTEKRRRGFNYLMAALLVLATATDGFVQAKS